jgi:hypothetical protein
MNDNCTKRLPDGPYDDKMLAMFSAVISAKVLTATFRTAEDWQRFYDNETGPMPFAEDRFRRLNTDAELCDAAAAIFVSTFLIEYHNAGSAPIMRQGAQLIGRGLMGA